MKSHGKSHADLRCSSACLIGNSLKFVYFHLVLLLFRIKQEASVSDFVINLNLSGPRGALGSVCRQLMISLICILNPSVFGSGFMRFHLDVAMPRQ